MRYSAALLAALLATITACDSGQEGPADGGKSDGGKKELCMYSPEPLALDQTRKVRDGLGILPGGRGITPEGKQVEIGFFPGNIVITPDGKTLIASNQGIADNDLVLVDTASGAVRQVVKNPQDWLFYGLAVSPDGKRLFASGGVSLMLYVYNLDGAGMATLERTVDLSGGFPIGLAVSKDGTRLYVAINNQDKIAVYDTTSWVVLRSGGTGQRPFGVALSDDEKMVYASNWAQAEAGSDPTVTALDEQEMTVQATLVVGKNPQALMSHGPFVYVFNADEDSLSVVSKGSVEAETVSLLTSDDSPGGIYPTGATISPDGTRMYISAAAKNSIEVYDLSTLKHKGSIPAGWYPTGVAVSSDGAKIFALNGKGEGSGNNRDGAFIANKMIGTLSIIDTPDDAKLGDLTKKVQANNARPMLSFPAEQCAGKEFPVPFAVGKNPVSPIDHVIFILKENRTFDQVFGAFPGVDGDPDLVTFGENITPNHHKLAREFTLMDNFYAESEVSMQGHLWATGMTVNDYSERTWFPSSRGSKTVVPLSGVDPVSCPFTPFIFQRLYEDKISFIDMGEVVGMLGQKAEILKYFDQNYPGGVFNLGVKDSERADYVIDRIKNNKLPRFQYMILPCDHTNGTAKGTPSPESMVADNDESLGRIVDALSKSPLWLSTLVLVVEDDPQDGADHVDAHRTFGMVISPWARHHSFGSFYATIERILGFKPLTVFDAEASPIFDVMTNVPDASPYNYIPRKIPETLNTASTPYQEECAKMDFTRPDNAPGLQKVLWHYMKGANTPYPGAKDED
ncbi:MAG: bifunctional YncE family protein/alkaline phosphatase family protein [Myxococcota bacterium]|jgi:YVTN family beta-propeller protein